MASQPSVQSWLVSLGLAAYHVDVVVATVSELLSLARACHDGQITPADLGSQLRGHRLSPVRRPARQAWTRPDPPPMTSSPGPPAYAALVQALTR